MIRATQPVGILSTSRQPRPDCVNLRERFGARFRIAHEEGYPAERTDFRREEEPWLEIIPCQNGHICLWGGEYLAACTHSRGRVATNLASMACTTVVQDGADGINAKFHVQDFEVVAKIMKPRRRRPRMSADLKAKLMAASQQYRFRPASRGSQEDRRREISTGPDGQAVQLDKSENQASGSEILPAAVD